MLDEATGVLFSGGDQSRLQTLSARGPTTCFTQRLHRDGLVIAGTSAGATALGRWMILGGDGREVAASAYGSGRAWTCSATY